MTRSGLAKGTATFVAMVVAGYFLGTYLDRHFTSDEATGYEFTPNDVVTASACVGEYGSWKNWQWPNVPTLSPKCADDRPSVE